jgi:hypothetical protein
LTNLIDIVGAHEVLLIVQIELHRTTAAPTQSKTSIEPKSESGLVTSVMMNLLATTAKWSSGTLRAQMNRGDEWVQVSAHRKDSRSRSHGTAN